MMRQPPSTPELTLTASPHRASSVTWRAGRTGTSGSEDILSLLALASLLSHLRQCCLVKCVLAGLAASVWTRSTGDGARVEFLCLSTMTFQVAYFSQGEGPSQALRCAEQQPWAPSLRPGAPLPPNFLQWKISRDGAKHRLGEQNHLPLTALV